VCPSQFIPKRIEELPASSNGLAEPGQAEVLLNVGRKKIRHWWIGKDINETVVTVKGIVSPLAWTNFAS
jgi:hypothetical protein